MPKDQRIAADFWSLQSVLALLGFREPYTPDPHLIQHDEHQDPSSLQHLAMQSLLSSQSLAISALEDIPVVLFPLVFMEVYARSHTEALKAVVQDWPFPYLPLHDLAESPEPQTFKAVLDGLELLLAKKEHPSRWKLQVLGLQKGHSDIWTQGYPTVPQISYPDILTDKPTVSCCSGMCEQPPLVIVTDLTLKQGIHDALQSYLLQWAQERKEGVQLCSRKLLSDSFSEIQKVLQVVRLDSIQKLMVCELWNPETMKPCVPYLSLMKNHHIPSISNRLEYFCTFKSRVGSYSWKSKAYFWHLPHVQELHMEAIVFVPGNLPAIIRRLSPLRTLSLDGCLRVETDTWFLPQLPHTRQLKYLLLRHLPMNALSPEPLRVLLELVVGTLETLVLDRCVT
ncbi:PRAME family member 12-like [Perognathus longimembris pacificus]|uniref:PRAME family member 12-like n=1 Tax=Perognathus longimembris pacificus TaxID=214514 RepID=UPI002018FCEC|nr:PRAME family member 12-like [Perognathus longimembris pacificus]